MTSRSVFRLRDGVSLRLPKRGLSPMKRDVLFKESILQMRYGKCKIRVKCGDKMFITNSMFSITRKAQEVVHMHGSLLSA